MNTDKEIKKIDSINKLDLKIEQYKKTKGFYTEAEKTETYKTSQLPNISRYNTPIEDLNGEYEYTKLYIDTEYDEMNLEQLKLSLLIDEEKNNRGMNKLLKARNVLLKDRNKLLKTQNSLIKNTYNATNEHIKTIKKTLIAFLLLMLGCIIFFIMTIYQ